MGLRDNSSPLVSVVVAAFDGASTIERALGSVLQQTYDRYEIIVVDDGSTDSTPEILTQHEAEYRSRFTVITQENSGCLAAREAGIRHARGEYIALLDQDDWWSSDKLAIQTAVLQMNPEIGLTFGNLTAVDSCGRNLGFMVNRHHERHAPSWEELICIFPLYPSSSLVRRELFNRVNYDLRFGFAGAYGDQDFHARLREEAGFHFSDRSLGGYYWHFGVGGAEMALENLPYFAAKYWNHKNLSMESCRSTRKKFLTAMTGEVRHLFRRLLKEQKNVASADLLRRFLQYSERMSSILHPDYSRVEGSLGLDPVSIELDDALTTLLLVYLLRPDLQRLFPEVLDGELGHLVSWAATVAQEDRPDYDGTILRQFGQEFRARVEAISIHKQSTASARFPHCLLRRLVALLDRLIPSTSRCGHVTRLAIACMCLIEQKGIRPFLGESLRSIRGTK